MELDGLFLAGTAGTMTLPDGEGRNRFSYRCAVDGRSAAEVGAVVTADFPEVMTALSARAEQAVTTG